ncbi:Hypothetical_protein [Hexamita inflata]|uniref:Hypothetical_protein n=1 Tax=Hexamita inflata TaxID=28002 RepID=A0AA86UHX9_9EUKA|nr:Hypothetical protein HINF_LOCUS46485 [Hexamita inflata]
MLTRIVKISSHVISYLQFQQVKQVSLFKKEYYNFVSIFITFRQQTQQAKVLLNQKLLSTKISPKTYSSSEDSDISVQDIWLLRNVFYLILVRKQGCYLAVWVQYWSIFDLQLYTVCYRTCMNLYEVLYRFLYWLYKF